MEIRAGANKRAPAQPVSGRPVLFDEDYRACIEMLYRKNLWLCAEIARLRGALKEKEHGK